MNRRGFLKGLLATATVVALAPIAPIVELPIEDATFVTFEKIAKIVLDKYRPLLAANITGARIKWEMLYARQCINVKREPDLFLNSV